MGLTTDDVLFVYSDMQVAADKIVERTHGKVFNCGTVYANASSLKFSKIITEDKLSQMVALYPDTKIVYKGKQSTATYNPVTYTAVTG